MGEFNDYTDLETLKKQNFVHSVYRRNKNTWQLVGYRCSLCDKTLLKEQSIITHQKSCRKINTLSKESFMPIQRIMKNNVPYYRWGDHGKLYRNREDAEKQAQAAYASGYKEKKEKKK